MKLLLTFGKIVTASAWLLMLTNLLSPFAGGLHLLLNLLLGITVLMHGLQLLMFHSLFRQKLPLQKWDYAQVFIFGVFALLGYRQRWLASA